MADYIIANYGKEIIVAETKLPSILDGYAMVSWNTLWAILQKAREINLKISIYEVGDCLLDWS